MLVPLLERQNLTAEGLNLLHPALECVHQLQATDGIGHLLGKGVQDVQVALCDKVVGLLGPQH